MMIDLQPFALDADPGRVSDAAVRAFPYLNSSHSGGGKSRSEVVKFTTSARNTSFHPPKTAPNTQTKMPQNIASNPRSIRPDPSRRFSVAPMMDWTDRHCRFFLRVLSKNALLYTEMVTTGALLHGDRERFLGHDETEHPLALQLGGSTPADLAACAQLAEAAGYDEVNLNVGCPSDRVQNNMIGACLMAHPALVADCVKAMRDAVSIPVTVKHRIGINGRDSYAQLCDFVGQVRDAGCGSFTVHARIAILEGLSPKENRDIPPLRYDIAAQLKKDFPELEIVLNGGIKTLADCTLHLQTFDGVMLGREAYHNPYLLAEVDSQLFGSSMPVISRSEALAQMRPYIEAHLATGGNMHHVTRHMLGLGAGFPGARRFRQLLSVDIHKHPDPLALLDQAGAFLEGR
jgi:tRNA-dihydrouridine synthase A